MSRKKPSARQGLAIVYRPTDSLVPYERNSRQHSEAQVAQIAASILEFGFTNPVLLGEDGVVIAGHGRIMAARSLKMAEVPTITLSGLSAEQRRALVIADNKLALNASWDDELLAVELGDLRDAGFDLGIVGFADDELSAILGGAAGSPTGQGGAGSLAAKFGVPPFSVLNAREGWWQERKRAWLALGIKSELGRGNENLAMSHPATTATIDFYAQKRAIEADLGREVTGSEAKAIMAERGTVKDGRAGNAKRKADAIPGGAGKNAAWRKGGRGATSRVRAP